MNNYYFTFGSDELFPYRNTYLIVRAENVQAALQKFREHYPNRPGSSLVNCAFYYNEEEAKTAVFPYYGEPAEVIE